VTIPIFEAAFLTIQGLFLFDHATSHTTDDLNALQALRLYIEPGGKQLKLQNK
jgi:hypothetical protein